ncbi:hypothetical protein N007_09995 [Alicyclobacillus acidoterrestris ATCC 49025]|nr:hypothetical protein N007_09995 [Alicyclobacillus acidoterrestris ATCC 49025]
MRRIGAEDLWAFWLMARAGGIGGGTGASQAN